MNKSVSILDKEYKEWVKDLALRYRSSQIKAAVKVNTELLRYNWLLGRDIVEMNVEQRWGESVITQLSKDLRHVLPGVQGLSKSNIYYCKKFYLLYNKEEQLFQQAVGKIGSETSFQQLAGIFEIPWGHHCVIMDKAKGNIDKAMFYVRQTIENGWSRAMLLNFISTDMYERQGKALTNFKHTLPGTDSGLAQEITKDPYNFAFTGITKPYNERILKDALLNNITRFLTELGTGFAYVGKEYRLQVGETENFIDLLICKEKDRIQAQYALESSSQPIGISEYDLERFYPEKIEGTMPTIEELESSLGDE